MKIKAKRVPVSIPTGTYTELKNYSEETGVSMTNVLTEALNDWLDTCGAARLEAVQQTRAALHRNVIMFPALQEQNAEEELN